MHIRPIPQDVKKGQRVEAWVMNAVLAALRSLDISGGPGIFVRKSPTGITISSKPPEAGRSTGGGTVVEATPTYPFDVEIGAGSDGSHFSATIQPGTINGLIPTDWDDVADLVTATTQYLILSVTSTDGEITGATLAWSTTAPDALPVQAGLPATAFDYLIGVAFGGAWYRTIGNGSLVATGAEVFRVSKIDPTPGTLPYDIYYTWAISVQD